VQSRLVRWFARALLSETAPAQPADVRSAE
jgi:hypothetical protein